MRAQKYPLIPEGTIVKVRLDIQQGGFNDESEGWTKGMATRGQTGAVYLKCEYKIQDGKFQGRKIWSLIGLHSNKSDVYKTMGRVLIKEILESSRGIDPKDESDVANKKRSIESLADLDNIVFVAEISIGTNQKGEGKNEIKKAITSDHQDYSKYMNSPSIEDQQNVSPF
jgi:hypothetical protein